jgi:hypothetical protein
VMERSQEVSTNRLCLGHHRLPHNHPPWLCRPQMGKKVAE